MSAQRAGDGEIDVPDVDAAGAEGRLGLRTAMRHDELRHRSSSSPATFSALQASVGTREPGPELLGQGLHVGLDEREPGVRARHETDVDAAFGEIPPRHAAVRSPPVLAVGGENEQQGAGVPNGNVVLHGRSVRGRHHLSVSPPRAPRSGSPVDTWAKRCRRRSKISRACRFEGRCHRLRL